GPDPSSGNRAVLGGVVANNATGAHSLQYGYIADYVESIRAVMADGTAVTLTSEMLADDPAAGQWIKACMDLLSGQKDLIEKAQPSTERNRSGYLIRNVISKNQTVDMARLMVGSEGTLAVFTEITLKTVPLPKVKGLVQFEFDTFKQMAIAVPIIAGTGARTCELMDRTLMDMARDSFLKYHDVIPADCAATLLVEHTGESLSVVEEKIQQTEKAVGTLSSNSIRVLEADKQALLWKSRKDAVPLLNRQKGFAHPIAFIEDVSVDNSKLDEYIAGLQKIGQTYNIPLAFYGHAGDGELHIRPYMDLRKKEEIQRMRQIADEVFALAWFLGGSISGEHGDGLVRAAFIRGQYGDEYYGLLCQIKQIFDPKGILNPGKIINDDPDIMEKNLRPATLSAADDFQTELCFEPNEFCFEVEQCNGCGVCLSNTPTSRMCPIFRGLNEEIGSSRAKANLLSAWMAGDKSGVDYDDRKLKQALSLCVNCKMCSIECPAGVDISKLIIEARTKLAHSTGFTMAELALSHNRWLSVLASSFAPLSNWIMGLPITRWFLQKLIGLDKTRRFPVFQRGSFIKKAQKQLLDAEPIADPKDRLVYFVDSYANWNDHDLGFATLDVLRKLGIEVVVPKQRPAPLPAYVYGNIKTAIADMQYNLDQIEPYVRKGYKVICSEPSAALCLTDEMRLLIDSDQARIVADNTYELIEYLNTSLSQNEAIRSKSTSYKGQTLTYHAPCHLKALRAAGISMDLLKKWANLEVTDINGGCCGLAGTAGMQKKHHDLSGAIGKQLAGAIETLNPDIIVTECAACKMQIEHLTGQTVIHPIKILRDAIC
ncbi:MAG: anaerobic glycerol-3-phosphate dehydrogenase subunit C, partial [Planctomycetota bacterium]